METAKLVDVVAAPCKKRNDEIVEFCEVSEADYFKVYKVFEESESIAVADCFDEHVAQTLVTALKEEMNALTITSSWAIDDVRDADTSNDESPLTDEQCKEVLELFERNHSKYGCSLDVAGLDFAITEYRSEKEV